jgi:NAD dependent epimerase/dehydratase family enzyme
MSWISLDDEVGAIVHLLDDDVSGPVNLTAPVPVRNREFATILGRVLHRPSFVPVPPFGPKLLLGTELADALLFESQRVDPAVLAASGYSFEHPELAPALRAVLDRD